jgi:hypothetical protein
MWRTEKLLVFDFVIFKILVQVFSSDVGLVKFVTCLDRQESSSCSPERKIGLPWGLIFAKQDIAKTDFYKSCWYSASIKYIPPELISHPRGNGATCACGPPAGHA